MIELMDALGVTIIPPPQEITEAMATPPSDPKFYIHFDKASMHVRSVSTNPTPEERQGVIEIDYDLGHALILGTKNMMSFEVILLKNETYELVNKSEVQKTIDRIDVVKFIYEIEEFNDAEIQMFIHPEDDTVEIHYNGDQVKNVPTKLYFTRYNDPSFLKCAFQLDVNTLEEIKQDGELNEWPNPVRLKLVDVEDLSAYGIRGQIKASIRNAKASS